MDFENSKQWIEKLTGDLDRAIGAFPASNREQQIRKEDAIAQFETLQKTLQRLFVDASRIYIDTEKSKEDLSRIFEEMVERGYLSSGFVGVEYHAWIGLRRKRKTASAADREKAKEKARRQFLDIFDSECGRVGSAYWDKRRPNGHESNASLVDFLRIAGVKREYIMQVAQALFHIELSKTTLSTYTRENSAYHEELQQIWDGTLAE